MPQTDPAKRRLYDRKRYELKLLKSGVMPKYSNIDIKLKNATDALISTKAMTGGAAVFSDRDLEKMPDEEDVEDVEEKESDAEDVAEDVEDVVVESDTEDVAEDVEDVVESDTEDVAEDVDEADYDYMKYSDADFGMYFRCSTAKLMHQISMIDKLTADPNVGEIVTAVFEIVQERLADFKYSNVEPIYLRVVYGIMAEMKAEALFHPSLHHQIENYIDGLFA